MACDTSGLQKQGWMDEDVDVDMDLAVWLLFTVLALVHASVFSRLWEAEVEQLQEPPAAETAREYGHGIRN
ncbi:hypothetical protein AAES_166062 [Amazona aestiva]|uniref:Uncharacterized protein n=1 Tax=Amazona aestiva TaxID=12930 RepID=A0A0Q3QKC4_AMAAE|nr:hypothetical protein AAES_166062 [Amazona aestiva]